MSDVENQLSDLEHEHQPVDGMEHLPELPSKPVRKPRKPMTEKQLENARKNMAKGRQKRKENIEMRKKLGLKTYQIPDIQESESEESSDEDEEPYEELVYAPVSRTKSTSRKKPTTFREPKTSISDAELARELAGLKAMLAQSRAPARKKRPATVVNVQMPQSQPLQPQEPVEAKKQKEKILMYFGN